RLIHAGAARRKELSVAAGEIVVLEPGPRQPGTDRPGPGRAEAVRPDLLQAHDDGLLVRLGHRVSPVESRRQAVVTAERVAEPDAAVALPLQRVGRAGDVVQAAADRIPNELRQPPAARQ